MSLAKLHEQKQVALQQVHRVGIFRNSVGLYNKGSNNSSVISSGVSSKPMASVSRPTQVSSIAQPTAATTTMVFVAGSNSHMS